MSVDILGIGTLVGSLLFFAGLVYVLVENRGFDEFRKPRKGPAERDETPKHPPQGRRAA